MAKLTGTNPEQVPTNADLGDMAYKDGENLQAGPLTITDGKVGIGAQSPSARLHTVQTGQSSTAVFTNTNASWANDIGFEYKPSGTTVSTLSLSNRSNGNVWIGSGYGDINFQLDENENNSRSTKVTIKSNGYLTLNGNDIGGTQVTIADDAVASITPPRNGGFMFVTTGGDGSFPQNVLSTLFFYDVAASLAIDELLARGAVNVSTSDVTGTTGTDGNVTVAVQTGVIKIENRSGLPYSFQITFL